MKTFDVALVSVVLGVAVDKVVYDEKSPDTVLLFRQFGMYKNEMVLENCPEYKYGIRIDELVSKIKKYCYREVGLISMRADDGVFTALVYNKIFATGATELEAICKVAEFVFRGAEPLRSAS